VCCSELSFLSLCRGSDDDWNLGKFLYELQSGSK
jgi:hypothetical protein